MLLVAAAFVAFPIIMVSLTDVRDDPSLSFMANLYARKDVLLEDAGTGPRLVVVGGSGTLFNIRCEMLEASTGLPTVNLGTHAGLGPEMLLARARRDLRAGDRVLLVPEYNMLSTIPWRPLPVRPWQWACTYDQRALMEAGPMTALWTAAQAKWPDLDAVHVFDRSAVVPPGPSRYPLGAMTPAGDLVWQPKRMRQLELATTSGTPDANNPDWARQIRGFLAWAESHGIEVAIVWPSCVPDKQVRSLADQMNHALRQITDQHGAIVLGQPSDWFVEEFEVSDTGNHATPRAALDITWRVIGALRLAGWAEEPPAKSAFLAGPGSVHPGLQSAAIRLGAGHRILKAEDVPDETQLLYTDDPSAVLVAAESGWAFTGIRHPLHGAALERLKSLHNDLVAVASRESSADRFGWLPVSWNGDGPFGVIWSIEDSIELGQSEGSRTRHDFTAAVRTGTILTHSIVLSADEPQTQILINDAPLVPRPPAAGLTLGVLDLDTGIVRHAVRFDPSGQPIGDALYILERGAPEIVSTPVLLESFIASGVTKPEITAESDGLHVTFTGPQSFAALPLNVDKIGTGLKWLDLRVSVTEAMQLETFSWTRGSFHLAELSPTTPINLYPGENRVLVPLSLDTHDEERAFAGIRGGIDTPGVTITHAYMVSVRHPDSGGN